MHARVHDDVKSQDMRFMGGMRKYMPWTFYSMAAATLAISGFPLTSGFFSKDGILFKTYANQVVHPYVASARTVLETAECKANAMSAKCQTALGVSQGYFQAPSWLGPVLFAVGIIAATCTAFYMFRLLFKTFWGEFRGWAIDPAAPLATDPFKNVEPLDDGTTEYGLATTTQESHGHDSHGSAEHEKTDARDLVEGDRGHHDHDHDHGHDDHHEEDLTIEGPPPYEAPWQMALPVAILGGLALFAGFLYAEPLHMEAMGHWLAPVFHEVVGHSVNLKHGAEKLEWPLMAPGVLAFAVGSALAYVWYVRDEERTPKKLMAEWPRLHRAAYNKWYVDEIYDATVIGGADALADGAALMDAWIVDGIIAKLTALVVSGFGAILRAFQTGVVHVYGGILAIGAFGLFMFFVRPHPEATVAKEGDTYTLEAAPGTGYTYKWDVETGATDKDFAAGEGSTKRTITVPQDATRKVTLEVKNAFGLVGKQIFTLTNPKPAPSVSVSVQGMPGLPPGHPPPRPPAGH
jgi:NADH-quinone oxidoreductase subunit L